jgi:hypothetical protein
MGPPFKSHPTGTNARPHQAEVAPPTAAAVSDHGGGHLTTSTGSKLQDRMLQTSFRDMKKRQSWPGIRRAPAIAVVSPQ